MITLQIAQQLKTKNINVVLGQLFCRQCKAKFLWEIDHCIDDQDKFQSVTDIDNEFTECQTPRKKLQSIVISPVSSHAFMETLKSNISEACKIQVDCLKDSESDSYDKNDLKEWMTWLGCTRQFKKNWKQHHIQSKSKFLPGT